MSMLLVVDNVVATKNVTSTLCQAPVRDHTYLVSYIGIAGAIIAFVAYLLRIGSKAVGDGSFFTNLGWDDGVITIAVAVMIPLSVFSPIRKSVNVDIETVQTANSQTVANLGLVSNHLWPVEVVVCIIEDGEILAPQSTCLLE
jgi:NADH:ubiquinone oxidoreductase subunit 6 (subunit J)